jgi:hypothetical protein
MMALAMRGLATRDEPAGRGGQLHADDREGEEEERHVTQVAEVVVVTS